jgi:hypothetical protein
MSKYQTRLGYSVVTLATKGFQRVLGFLPQFLEEASTDFDFGFQSSQLYFIDLLWRSACDNPFINM